MGHYAHLRAQVGEQVRFCDPNYFALRTCTLYFQYLNFDISCSLSRFKIGQGQPIVTILLNLIRPESPMLHNKFQGFRPFKSSEENFQRVLP